MGNSTDKKTIRFNSVSNLKSVQSGGSIQIEFYYRAIACNAMYGIAVEILSVCLSVHQMRVL